MTSPSNTTEGRLASASSSKAECSTRPEWRCHTPTQRLVTQMYFPDDPLFCQDPIFNSVRDPEARQRMVSETWRADPDGHFDHPYDLRKGIGSRVPHGFTCFARVSTVDDGRFEIITFKPGPLPAQAGLTEAPHLDVSVFARGMLDRTVTRIYFPDEEVANASDPVLSGLDPDRRHTLIGVADQDGLRFDIHLQGEHETVFFQL